MVSETGKIRKTRIYIFVLWQLVYINSIEEGTHRDEDGFVTSHTFIVISIRIEWLFYKRRLECADLGTLFFFFFF